MARPSRMNAEDETRLLATLDRAKDLVDAGSDAQSAIIKAATEQKLPAGHITPLVHSWNTGEANMVRLRGDDVFGKAASAPLVNPQAVLEAIYPSEVEAPREKSAADHFGITGDYNRDPRSVVRLWNESRETPEAYLEKTASLRVEAPTRSETFLQRDKRTVEPYIAVAHWKKACHEQDILASRATDAFTRSLYETHSAILRNRSDWTQLRKYASRLYGAKAEPVLALLEERQAVAKSASAIPEKVAKLLTPDQSPVRELVNCIGAWERMQSTKKEAEALRNHEGVKKVRLWLGLDREKSAADEPTPSEPKTTPPPGGSPPRKSVMKSFGEGMGKGWSTGLERLVDPLATYVTGPRGFEGKDDKAFEALTEPSHEMKLQQIRTQALLQDLMANDEHIAEHDPAEVTEAFNELQRLAPRALAEPSMVRAALRKRLAQGQVDTHELKQLSELEGQLRSNRELPRFTTPDAVRPVVATNRRYGKPSVDLKSLLLNKE